MIDSVYSALDAYKRQGRINVPAALSSLPDWDVAKEAVARRTALTAETEFLIDCFALANSKLGRLLENRKKMDVTWDDIFRLIEECRNEARVYWESHRRVVSPVECFELRMRTYLAKCVWYYHTRGADTYAAYNDLKEQYLQAHTVSDSVKHFLAEPPVYFFIPEFIRGITPDVIQVMATTCEWSQKGFIAGGSAGSIVVRREFQLLGFESFVCYTENGTTNWVSDHFVEALENVKPELAVFLRDPVNLDYCTEDVCYGIMTQRALYFWGPQGSSIDPRQLPMSVLHDLMSESMCNGLTAQPAKFYSGVQLHGEVMHFLEDITEEMYDHFGWHGGSVLSYRIATQGFPRDENVTDEQLSVDDWKCTE